MELHGSHFIAGSLHPGKGEPFRAVDPVSGEEMTPDYFDAQSGEIDEALGRAEAVHVRRLAGNRNDRALLLERVADGLEEAGDRLVERAMAESGLPQPRIIGERGRTCGQLRMFSSIIREGSYLDVVIETALPDRQPIPRPDIRRWMQPLGPVVVFGASNFPLAFSVAGGDTASALAVGCPVVLKAHPAHPGTSEIVAGVITEAISACGLSAGLFSMVHGRGHGVGEALVRHPATAAVGFTGSQAGGMALWRIATERDAPIPVFAEMGSVNPIFILPAALATRGEAIATDLAASIRLAVGQFCTSPGVIVTVRGEGGTDFCDTLGKALSSEPAGTMLHSGISANYRGGRQRLAAIPAVEVVAEGPIGDGPCAAASALMRVDGNRFIDDPRLQAEVFGPSTLLVECSDVPEMLEAARAIEGQLTATVHSDSDSDELIEHKSLVHLLEERAGRVVFGGVPTGVEVGEAIQHGGPWPATTDSRFTSVGTAAIARFLRPICYQDCPPGLLPDELRDGPAVVSRRVDGQWEEPGSS